MQASASVCNFACIDAGVAVGVPPDARIAAIKGAVVVLGTQAAIHVTDLDAEIVDHDCFSINYLFFSGHDISSEIESPK